MLDALAARPLPWPKLQSWKPLYLTGLIALLFWAPSDADSLAVTAESPLHFSVDSSTDAYFFSIEVTGENATATPNFQETANHVVGQALNCETGGCQIVEARNMTYCQNEATIIAPPTTATLSSQQDKDVLTAFLGDSDRNRTVVRQYMTMIPSPEGSRRLLATYAAEPSPPPPPKPDCICASELTFYITFSREDDELLLNQTLALFSGGIFYTKMQHANFILDNVTLLSYQKLACSPASAPLGSPQAPRGPPSNTVFTKAGYIPGPKPAVMSNDTVAGPVSFVLALNGPDALVTNDTLLTVLYDLLTNSSGGTVSNWFSTLNTVISSVTQTEPQNPKRLQRRSLLQAPGPGGSAPPNNSCGLYGSNPVPVLSVTTKLYQVPRQAVGQVEAELNALVDENILLNGFNLAGLRICAVSLTSFSGDSTPPAPAPSSNTTTYASRNGSNHGVVVIALSIAIPVSIVGTAAITLALIWYRRHRRTDSPRSQSKLRLKFSGDSSLFGSPRSSIRPEGSAQSIIQQLHADSYSSMSRLIDMPWSDWKIEPSELTIATRPDGAEWLLGSGASGRVYKALRNGVQIVAVKVFKEEATRGAITSLTSPHHAAQFKQEISILKSCHDKNIVQFVGACLAVGQTILVTEYLENGDLHKAINSQQGNRYHWYRMQTADGKPLPNSGMARRVALDIARGLHFLHTRKIVHFDLKSANILLARDFTAKIADVGLARILHDDVLSSRREVGTFAWAAPEVLLGQRITEAADIYSFGVLLHELSATESPRNRHLQPLNIPAQAPPEIADLMSRCLDVDPKNRPTARELVAMLSCMPAVPPFPPAAEKSANTAEFSSENPLVYHQVMRP